MSVSKGLGATEETNSGANDGLSCSPSASTNRPVEKMPPAAFLTPSTRRTWFSTSAGKGGRSISSPWPTVLGEIATSVPAKASLKMSSKERLIVSVST